MKAIILAAGKGTRMGELGRETPKPLLKTRGRTLLEYKLDEMPEAIDEVILVVGHLKEKIIETVGEQYGRLKISYMEQEEPLGTAHALFVCKERLENEEKFLVLMGDDIYAPEDMAACLNSPWSILISERDSVRDRAKVVFDESGSITDIIERYRRDLPGFICAGMYCLTPEIFDYPPVSIGVGESGLPQTILSAKDSHTIKPIQATFWLQINSPDDLRVAEEYFKMKK